MNRHERIFKVLADACDSMDPAFNKRISAALVYKNDIISLGFNRRKTHPFQKLHSKHTEAIWLHAENDCISKALRRCSIDTISRSTLYVYRTKHQESHGEMIGGLAKPCRGCMRAIASYNIRNVCYSLDDAGYDWL